MENEYTTFEDPLTLDLKDDVFVEVIDQRIDNAKAWYKKNKDLLERQKKNKDYLFGRQIDEKEFADYAARYIDNVIYEGEAYIKPIALSRLPDLFVKPGNDTPESKEIAKNITEVINSDLRKRENRKVLAMAFKHHPVYFIGCIKYRWDPEKGKDGDYCFEVVHPDNLVLDPVASNNPDDMSFVAETVSMTVKEAVMRFPDKEQELYNELQGDGTFGDGDEIKEAKLATKIKIKEVWFTWYEKKEDKYKRIEGVAWKYKKLLLKKMKNPNWDYEGDERLFVLDEAQEHQDVPEEDFIGSMVTGMPIEGLQQETVFHNHFENPRKPYILIGYDQWGEMPYDETSRLEQVLYLQDNINKRGRQITEMGDRARGKHVFSSDSGLKKEDIEDLDMADPNTDVFVHGKLSDVHTFIPGEQPSAPLFQEQDSSRMKVFAKMGVKDTTRGEVTTDTATTAQIAREADFGRIDDLTEETINYAAEEMGNAAMQMIKLRYTQEHLRRLLGKDGEVTFAKINRDMIEDGMEVTVHASGVDKIMRKREAFERAKMQLTDPLTFFEDTDAPNPKERTERLLAFNTNPAIYEAKYLKGMENTEQMAAALGQQPIEGQPQGGQQVMMDIAMLQQGQVPQPPQQLTAEYIQTLNNFLRSPEFTQLDPNAQQTAQQYARQLVESLRGSV